MYMADKGRLFILRPRRAGKHPQSQREHQKSLKYL
jgi:hypothetical protein